MGRGESCELNRFFTDSPEGVVSGQDEYRLRRDAVPCDQRRRGARHNNRRLAVLQPLKTKVFLIGASGILALGVGGWTIAAHAASGSTQTPSTVSTLAAVSSPPAVSSPAPSTPETEKPDAPGVEAPETSPAPGTAAGTVASDGPGGHEDNPNDPNADHQFDGNE
jgi:hypothetical protein